MTAQLADAINVLLGTITSSPGPMPRQYSAKFQCDRAVRQRNRVLASREVGKLTLKSSSFVARPVIHPSRTQNRSRRLEFPPLQTPATAERLLSALALRH